MSKLRSIALIVLVSLSSCDERTIVGRGAEATDRRQLERSGFTNIRIDAPLDAHITVGDEPSLELKGYGNVLRCLRSEVRGNTLHIFIDEHIDLHTRENISAAISLPKLTGLDVSGAAHVLVTGDVQVPEFRLGLSGASTVDIRELHVRSFEADLSGAAELTLSDGDIDKGSFDLSGGGEIKAFGVDQREALFDLSGAAKAEVTVTERLDAEISGAGVIAYKGHPAVSQDVSGAGSLVDAN